jgi:hypothetical protein
LGIILRSAPNNQPTGDVLDYFEDDSEEVTEMEALREKYTAHVTREVEERLGKSKYKLDDSRTLSLVIGSNTRLESVRLPTLGRFIGCGIHPPTYLYPEGFMCDPSAAQTAP